MTPKDKAKNMVSSYGCVDIIMNYNTRSLRGLSKEEAVKCAKIAVDEIIDAIDWHEFETSSKELEYWQEVKQELEKL